MIKRKMNKKLLMDYLLDRLDSTTREQLEERYFLDDESFGELMTVYEELTERYHQDQLEPEDRNAFEKKYLRSRRGVQRMEFETTLVQAFSKVGRERPAPKKLVTALRTIEAWFAEKTSARVWQLAASGAAIVLVALVARIWLFAPTVHERMLVEEFRFVYQSSDNGFKRREATLKTRGGTPEHIDTRVVLTELDRYALEIQPQSEVFLYLFQWDTHGNMTVLFPHPDYAGLENPLTPGRVYRFPRPPNWFTLDETPGRETIGLGVSESRWEALEDAIGSLDEGDEHKKRTALVQIRSFIREAEKNKSEDFYGSQFSFGHVSKGGGR